MIVVAGVHKEKTVLQQSISLVEILAEKRAARFRKRAFFHIAPNAAQRLANQAVYVFLVRLDFRDFRPHHVSLLAVLEKLAAAAYPFFALHQNAGKLIV